MCTNSYSLISHCKNINKKEGNLHGKKAIVFYRISVVDQPFNSPVCTNSPCLTCPGVSVKEFSRKLEKVGPGQTVVTSIPRPPNSERKHS